MACGANVHGESGAMISPDHIHHHHGGNNSSGASKDSKSSPDGAAVSFGGVMMDGSSFAMKGIN